MPVLSSQGLKPPTQRIIPAYQASSEDFQSTLNLLREPPTAQSPAKRE